VSIRSDQIKSKNQTISIDLICPSKTHSGTEISESGFGKNIPSVIPSWIENSNPSEQEIYTKITGFIKSFDECPPNDRGQISQEKNLNFVMSKKQGPDLLAFGEETSNFDSTLF
jgi:hypothetical protein